MNGLKLRAGGLLLAALFFVGCSTHKEAFGDAKTEIGNQDEVIRSLSGRNDALTAENTVLRTRAEAAELETKRLHEVEATYRRATSSVDDLEKRLRDAEARAGGPDSDISLKTDWRGMKYEVAERLLFEPGKSTLRESGKKALQKVAENLRDGSEKIIVEGHTDNKPVVVHAKEYPLGNLQLSGERALKVADYLSQQGGLQADRVSYAGLGEHQPVEANDSDANRARNRRVEIIIVRNPPQRN